MPMEYSNEQRVAMGVAYDENQKREIAARIDTALAHALRSQGEQS
jgi:hypothetical protein